MSRLTLHDFTNRIGVNHQQFTAVILTEHAYRELLRDWLSMPGHREPFPTTLCGATVLVNFNALRTYGLTANEPPELWCLEGT